MLTIGKLSQATGVKVPTIRYYEQIGLLPETARNAGNQRLYDNNLLSRLKFIRHSRDLGFPLEAIRDLLSLTDKPDAPCTAVHSIATTQLQAVRERIDRLRALEAELSRMIAQDRHDTVANCRVIEALGDHSLCLHDHAD